MSVLKSVALPLICLIASLLLYQVNEFHEILTVTIVWAGALAATVAGTLLLYRFNGVRWVLLLFFMIVLTLVAIPVRVNGEKVYAAGFLGYLQQLML